MELFDAFLEIVFDYWYLILLFVSSPYILYFLSRFFQGTISKLEERIYRKKLEEKFEKPITDEEKNLGIKITNKDPEIYKKRIEALIELLNSEKGVVSVNAIEAIMIVDFFSDKVVVNKNGELVITLESAKEFSKMIYDDPISFITYVKAIESKLDFSNDENKIELGDILYMMRNAKKFGLYIEEDDTELTYKIKSAIHESNYKDVVMKIVDSVEVLQEESVAEVILNNICEIKEDKKQEPIKGDDIVFAEKLEDGKVKIKTKDGKVIVKDDFMTYSIFDPNSKENSNNKSVSGNTGSQSEYADTDNNKEKDKLFDCEPDELKIYTLDFGELDQEERKFIETKEFKYRLKRYHGQSFRDVIEYEVEKFEEKNFFENEGYLETFLSYIFDMDNSNRDIVPYVYFTVFKKEQSYEKKFITISIDFLISIIYSSIRSKELKESFYHKVYRTDNGKKVLNNKSVKIVLSNINDKYKLFFEAQNGELLLNTVYNFSGKTILTNIVRFKISSLEQYAKEFEGLETKLKAAEEFLLGSIKTECTGVKADNFKNPDFIIDHNTFFRMKRNEKR